MFHNTDMTHKHYGRLEIRAWGLHETVISPFNVSLGNNELKILHGTKI